MAAFDYDLGILGGGAIGVEMAQAFRRLGSKVTIVEFTDQVLGPEDPDIALILRFLFDLKGRACTPEGEAG